MKPETLCWNIYKREKKCSKYFLGCDFMNWQNMSQTSNEILGQLTLTLEVCIFFEMMTDKISTTQECLVLDRWWVIIILVL